MCNDAYVRTFGAPDTVIAPEDERGVLIPPESTPRMRAARGESFSTTFTISGDSGSRKWYEAVGQPIEESGPSRGGVIVIRDISERSLHKLQDEFLAIASHELRSPMTSLHGFLEMILRRLGKEGQEDRVRLYAEQALRQTKRLERLVTDLVDVSRLQAGGLTLRSTDTDLVALIEDVASMVQLLGERPHIRISARKRPLTVKGDPDRLQQVVLNLLTNAMTYAAQTEHID